MDESGSPYHKPHENRKARGEAAEAAVHGKWKSEARVLDAVLLTDLGGGRTGARLCWAADGPWFTTAPPTCRSVSCGGVWYAGEAGWWSGLLPLARFPTPLCMPICKHCEHRGEGHNWISPTCWNCGNRSAHCPFYFEKYQRGRKRGQCRDPDCDCAKYVPLSDRPRPINKFAGRLLYRKRG